MQMAENVKNRVPSVKNIVTGVTFAIYQAPYQSWCPVADLESAYTLFDITTTILYTRKTSNTNSKPFGNLSKI